MKRLLPDAGPWRDPLFLVALAYWLVWAAAALWARPIGDYGVETDFYGDFATYAREWLHGHPTLMTGFRGPFYYIVIGLLSVPFRDLFLPAKLLSATMAALGIWFTGDLIRRLFAPLAGLAAGLALAANSTLMEYSYRACSDLVFWGLCAAALWLVFQEERPGEARRWLVAGGVAAAACLTRYNGAVMVPAALVVAGLTLRPWRRAARGLGLFLAAWLVVIGPWALYVWSRTGNPAWNNNYENVAIEAYVEEPGLAQAGGFMTEVDFVSMKEVLEVDPDQVSAMFRRNAAGHMARDARDLIGLPWAALAVLGFGLGFRSLLNRRALAFLAVWALSYVTLLPVFYSPRFMISLLPFWAAGIGLLAAMTVGVTTPFLTRPRSVQLWTAVLAVAAIAATVREAGGLRGRGPGDVIPVELLSLARQARAHGAHFDGGTPIAARKPHIGYYLGAPVIPVPSGSIEDLRRSGARYLLVSGIETANYPSLSGLMQPDPKSITPGLHLVAQASLPVPGADAVRAAALYAVDDPVPWKEPVSSPLKQPRPVPSGMTRLDFLRFELARWYVRWNSNRDPTGLFRRLSPAALERPDVMLVAGDTALEGGDPNAAGVLYEKVLSRDPSNTQALSSLAGIHFLRGDREGFHHYLIQASGKESPGLDDLRRLAWTYLRTGDFGPALGPVAGALEIDPTLKWARMGLAYVFHGIRRWDEARGVAQAYLRDYPGDLEAENFLRSLDENQARFMRK